MRSRLEDLLATAERQLAARSYDAAIDTYRTALAESGATEARVEELLEAACRARDEARGIVRAVGPPAPPVEPPVVEMAVPPPIEPAPVPVPAPPAPVDGRPIEPPAFHLIEDDPSILYEDDPSILERPRQDRYAEIDVLSILDPTPAPKAPDLAGTGARLLIAFVIAMAVVLVAYYAK